MYKQIIIVRKDLQMSPGKLAGQVAHAATAYFTHLIRSHVVGEVLSDCLVPKEVYRVETFDIPAGLYEQWINGHFTKVVLQAKNKSQLLKAKTLAEQAHMIEGVDFFLIRDICNTELEPEEDGKTLTCIGFRPMDELSIDRIGKKFHLYVEK